MGSLISSLHSSKISKLLAVCPIKLQEDFSLMRAACTIRSRAQHWLHGLCPTYLKPSDALDKKKSIIFFVLCALQGVNAIPVLVVTHSFLSEAM